MSHPVHRWSQRDLSFLARTLIPESGDVEHLVDLMADDEQLVEAMLHDDRLFRQLAGEEGLLSAISPELFFRVLLLRARQDLEGEAYTVERRRQQKVVLFDAPQVVELLRRPGVIEYLARMLASFTHINSVTIPVRVRPGVWRRIRINDLDVDSLIRYAEILDPERRFAAYQRIADACLFLAGLFPEHLAAGRARMRLQGSLLGGLEDYEAHGRRYYGLAAGHEAARLNAVDEVLELLAQQFILAEKPLALLSQHYLALRKLRLFDV